MIDTAIGRKHVPEIQVLPLDLQENDESYPYEYNDRSHLHFSQDKLRLCIDFWCYFGRSEFTLDVIQNGYKIPSFESPNLIVLKIEAVQRNMLILLVNLYWIFLTLAASKSSSIPLSFVILFI